MARQFNGSSQYYTASSAPISAVPYSFGAWVRLDAAASGVDDCMMLGDASSSSYEALQFNTSNGKVRLRTFAGGGSNLGGALYDTDVWHHVFMVAAATDDRALYLDGGGKVTKSTDKTVTMGEMSVGVRTISSTTNYFQGRIEHAVVYDAALTDDEVAALASGVNPLLVRGGNLVGYWPLWGQHAAEIDLMGTTSLTATGSPTAANGAPVVMTYDGSGLCPNIVTATVVNPPYSIDAHGMWSAGATTGLRHQGGASLAQSRQAGATASARI
tara:strand:+ start:2198 stop:3010 length:813 start_codon:yes stop_codon:yes gene_type:complete